MDKPHLPAQLFFLALTIAACHDDDETPPDLGLRPGAGVIITELQASPCTPDPMASEWFEITNISSTLVELRGWTVQDGSGEAFTIPLEDDLYIVPGVYLVFAASSQGSGSGGREPDYIYGGFTLSYDADQIILLDAFGTIIDAVSYDSTWPDPGCAPLQLSSTALDAQANDAPENWCADPTLPADDLGGSPGRGNADCGAHVCGDGRIQADEVCDDGQLNSDLLPDTCRRDCTEPGCGDGVVDSLEECDLGSAASPYCDGSCLAGPPAETSDLLITEIMRNSADLEDLGEWIEIVNTTAHPLAISGCRLGDGTGHTYTLGPERVIMSPADRLILARSGDEGLNGGIEPDFVWSDISLDNEADTIELDCGAITIDSVTYNDALGWPDDAGFSMSFSQSAILDGDTDNPDDWCSARTPYGDGNNYGSPGWINPVCADWRIDQCRLQEPLDLEVEASHPASVYGRVFEAGITDRSAGVDRDPQLVGQLGYGSPESFPKENPDWTWSPASGVSDWDDSQEPGFDQYEATVGIAQAGHYAYAFRFSRDRGLTWTYCDRDTGQVGQDGSEDGYQPERAGEIAVLNDRAWSTFDSSRLVDPDAVLSDGQYFSELRSLIIENGMTLEPSTSLLTTDYLDTIKVFLVSALDEETGTLTEGEQVALRHRVEVGGTLIVIGDVTALEAYESFTSLFGVTGWTARDSASTVEWIADHPIAGSAAGIEIDGETTFDCGEDCRILAEYEDQSPVAAVVEPSTGYLFAGRILILGNSDMLDSNTIEQHPYLADGIVRWARPISATLTFPEESDQRSTHGDNRYWVEGDWVSGDRNTDLSNTYRAEVRLLADPNMLSCDQQVMLFSLNEIPIGDYSIQPGQSEVIVEMIFDWIDGPTYQLSYETLRDVRTGCGSAGISDSGSTVTLWGIGQ